MNEYRYPVEMLAQEMADRLADASRNIERLTQRAEAAERDCKTAMDQRDSWRQKAEAAEAVLKDLQATMEYADLEFAGWGIPESEAAYKRFMDWLQPT